MLSPLATASCCQHITLPEVLGCRWVGHCGASDHPPFSQCPASRVVVFPATGLAFFMCFLACFLSCRAATALASFCCQVWIMFCPSSSAARIVSPYSRAGPVHSSRLMPNVSRTCRRHRISCHAQQLCSPSQLSFQA